MKTGQQQVHVTYLMKLGAVVVVVNNIINKHTSGTPLLYVYPTGDSVQTRNITQSVPDWLVCIQTNVLVSRCLQTQ